MWYLIIMCIAMIVAHLLMYAHHKASGTTFSFSYKWGPGVIIVPFLVGIVWPVSLVFYVGYIVFHKWLKPYYETFVEWLAKNLFTNL